MNSIDEWHDEKCGDWGRQRGPHTQVNETFDSTGTHICFTFLHFSSDFFPIQALRKELNNN